MTVGNWVAVGFCILSVPITLSITAYAFARPAFLPSRELFWLSQIVGPVVAVLIFGGGLNMFWSIWRKRLTTILSGPLLFLLMWHLFVMGPLPYLMHLSAISTHAVVVESISSAGSGGKTCRNSATIAGDPLLYNRRLCQIGSGAVEVLRNGGQVALFGEQTRYGLAYERFEIRR